MRRLRRAHSLKTRRRRCWRTALQASVLIEFGGRRAVSANSISAPLRSAGCHLRLRQRGIEPQMPQLAQIRTELTFPNRTRWLMLLAVAASVHRR